MSSTTGVFLTLKFNFAQQIRFNGWSERYALGYADIPTAIASQANIDQFIFDRVYCLGVGPLLESATLSAFTQPASPGQAPLRRNTLAIDVPSFPAAGSAYNKVFDADNPKYFADFSSTVYYMALQTALSGNPVYRRNCWIAGLPDGADQTNSGAITDSPTLTAVKKFMGDLQNSLSSNGGRNSVSIDSIDRSNGNPIKPCTAWNIPLNTYTVPNHGFVLGQPVIALGMRTSPGGKCPKGRYLIGPVVDANTLTLQDSAAPSTPIKLGGFRAAIVTFNTVSLCLPKGFTTKKKGRPSGLAAGRRLKQSTVRA